MADNFPVNDSSLTPHNILTDELSTLNGADVSTASPRIHAQRVKLMIGTDGLASDVSGSNPLAVTLPDEIPAGTQHIGSVDIDGFPSLPSGTNNIGDVDVLSLPSLPAGNNNIGDVDIATMPAANVSTDSIGAAPYAETSLAGATPYKLISAANTNATVVKSSVGKIFYIAAFNNNASARYLKLYDKSSSPSVGTDTPKHVFLIPGGSSGFTIAFPVPAKFASGIGLALTTGITDADTGAVAANEIVVNLGYV